MGPDSSYMNWLNSNATNQTDVAWAIDMGQLLNQSFAGANFTGNSTPSMFIGNGDWSSVFNVTDSS